jgi:hypothetical protein
MRQTMHMYRIVRKAGEGFAVERQTSSMPAELVQLCATDGIAQMIRNKLIIEALEAGIDAHEGKDIV